MKRFHLLILSLLLVSFSLNAEDDKVNFAYDIDFETRFTIVSITVVHFLHR